MPVSIFLWYTEIGILSAKLAKYLSKSKYHVSFCTSILNKIYTICYMFLLLSICLGEIELSRGGFSPISPKHIKSNKKQKKNTCQFLSFSHWNLNSVETHNFLKLSLRQAFNNV